MNPMNDVATIRKVAFMIGTAALAVAAFMAFRFGWSMSSLHALLLGLLTLSGSIVFPYAGHLKSTGSKSAWLYMAIGLAFLGAEYFSHIGYTIGQRVMNTEETGVQNASYKIKQDSVDRNVATLAQLRKDLDELKSSNPWVTTISADGLRAQIAPMDEAIRQEANRGGCGPICLKLQKDKADVEDRIALVERSDDLSRRIETTQKLVNAKEAEATHAEFKSSPVVAQTKFVSQLATFELDPGEGALTWTQIGIGALLALVTTFLAPVMFSIAWGPLDYASGLAGKLKPAETQRKPEADIASLIRGEVTAALKRFAPESPAPARHAPQEPHYDVHLHNGKDLDVHGMAKALKRALAEGRLNLAAA